jgi:hypothetical protein
MIGSKTCSPPLFHSEILHLIFWVIIILLKNISDISQKCPIRLLTLNPLPFFMALITLSAVSGSTRFGLFVMETNTQRLESMFVSFRMVACLFMIYSSGICMWTSKAYKPADDATREPCRCMMMILLMVLTIWLHPVDLDISVEQQTNLSARTKSCRHSANHSKSRQLGLARSPLSRHVLHILAEAHRTLAELTHFAQKLPTFNSRFNDPDLAAALRYMTSHLRSKI